MAKLLVGCALGGVLLYALHRGGLPLLPPASALEAVNWWSVPPYFALLTLSAYFRGVRWRLLLRPVANVSNGRALRAVLVGAAAVWILPFRLGEMARPYMISRDKRVNLAGALATVVAERVLDGLILSLILAAALLGVPTLIPMPETVVGIPVSVSAVRGYAWTFLLVFGGAFLALVFFHFAHGASAKLIHVLVRTISPAVGDFIAAQLESFAKGLAFLTMGSVALRYLLETIAYWLTAALSYWMLGWGTGILHASGSPMGFGEACAVMGMLGIATVLPGPPGLLGLFQAGVYAALTMYFPAHQVTSSGAAFVFLLYVLQMSFTLVAGAASLAFELRAGASSTGATPLET